MSLFHDQAELFLDNVFENLESLMIDVKNMEMDHICFRTSSIENYELVKNKFSYIGKPLIESMVGGRPIATYKLDIPIEYKGYIIDIVEVPAPKAGVITVDGFEHVEFVIEESFTDFMSKYPHVNFKTKGISKQFNPEVAINFKDLSVKFHHLTLENVICVEKNEKLTRFFFDEKFMDIFSKFNPHYIGHSIFEGSGDTNHISIIFPSTNEEEIKTLLMKNYSSDSKYQGNGLSIDFSFFKDSFKNQENREFNTLVRFLKHSQLNIGSLVKDGHNLADAYKRLSDISLDEIRQMSDVEIQRKFKKSEIY